VRIYRVPDTQEVLAGAGGRAKVYRCELSKQRRADRCPRAKGKP